jgi:hypothetical protein
MLWQCAVACTQQGDEVNNRVAEKEGVDTMAMCGGIRVTVRRGEQQEGRGGGSGCCGKVQWHVW